VTAEAILQLLREKHSEDVFVAECKSGETYRGRHVRLDAWVMPRSWVRPETTGYEIKVGRSDFLRDDKWTDYLAMCHKLYFVCPHGLIGPDELPPDVGLLWVSKTGSRLFTKRKAVPRKIEIPESLWRYVLMCRTKITRENRQTERADYWQNWLREREQNKAIGYAVSAKVRESIEAAQAGERRATALVASYERTAKALAEAGFDISTPINEWMMRRRIEELQGAIPAELRHLLRSTIARLTDVADAVEQIEAGQ